jgi:hypothetical protein
MFTRTDFKQQRIPNDIHEFERFFADIDEAKIVINSSSAWYHIYELLSERQVVLSNPVKTKATACSKVKTDGLDALTLTDVFGGECIAQYCVPPRITMNLRGMVRH